MSDSEILEGLVRISKRAATLGYVVAGEGNTSARSSNGREFWIKRSGCSLGEVGPQDFIKMDILRATRDLAKAQEAVVDRSSPEHRASIEAAMHAVIYDALAATNYIVHTHPPNALAGCCSADPKHFFLPQFPDFVVYLGVPSRNWIFLEYASPGPKIAGLLKKALSSAPDDVRVVVLEKHGIICVGHSAAEAMARTEVLEKASYVRLMSLVAGRSETLGPEEVAFLENMEAEKYRQRVLRDQL